MSFWSRLAIFSGSAPFLVVSFPSSFPLRFWKHCWPRISPRPYFSLVQKIATRSSRCRPAEPIRARTTQSANLCSWTAVCQWPSPCQLPFACPTLPAFRPTKERWLVVAVMVHCGSLEVVGRPLVEAWPATIRIEGFLQLDSTNQPEPRTGSGSWDSGPVCRQHQVGLSNVFDSRGKSHISVTSCEVRYSVQVVLVLLRRWPISEGWPGESHTSPRDSQRGGIRLETAVHKAARAQNEPAN